MKRKPLPKRRRAAEKRRARRVRRANVPMGPLPWKPLLGAVLCLVLVTWWVRYDPAGWLRLQQIHVSGPTDHLSVAEIEELAAPTFGIPLMSLDLDPVRQRIEDNPWVRHAGLRRLLPNTLYIHVQEHVPAAIVTLPQQYLVSTEGLVFKPVTAKDPKDLPIITGLTKEMEPHLLQQRIIDSLAVVHRLKATGALEPFGLSEVHWKKQHRLSLMTRHRPFPIELGTGPWQNKLEQLTQVMPHVERDGRTPLRVALDQGDGVVVRY